MKLNQPNKINQIPSNNYYFIANKYNICTKQPTNKWELLQ